MDLQRGAVGLRDNQVEQCVVNANVLVKFGFWVCRELSDNGCCLKLTDTSQRFLWPNRPHYKAVTFLLSVWVLLRQAINRQACTMMQQLLESDTIGILLL